MADEGRQMDALAERALLAHVRHEIRTPINAILGYSEMLLEDAPPQAVPDLQRIRSAGTDLLALVDRHLGSAKADANLDWDALGAEIRHAMRTPLDTVLGYCEILLEDLDGEAPESFAADLRRIEFAARRLLTLIEDLVQLVRQGSKKAADDPENHGVSAGIQEAVSGVVHAIRQQKASAMGTPHAGGSLLVADDNPVDRDLLVRRLSREGYAVTEAENGRQALELARATGPDLILLDVLMPELNGFQVLDQLKADRGLRPIPVIMLSSWDEADSVARCLEAGAEDYLPKPANPVVLLARITGCIEKKRKLDLEVAHLRRLEEEQARCYGELVGKHASVAELRKQIDRLAKTAGPVLIQGERGVGKELVARLIHQRSARKDAPLLSIDSASIADSPWGDKLLGESGSLESSQASSREATYLDLVDGGTLLLKNLEQLPVAVQDRLARFLDPDSQLPGQRRPDARLVATCSGDLSRLVEAGQVRPALAEVLSRQALTVSSLKERKRDIPELAAYFLRRCAARLNKRVEGFEDSAITRLVTYDFPFANVQELEMVVERAVSLTPGETIGTEEVFLGPPPSGQPGGFNLLELPAPLVKLGLKLFPGPARILTAVIFAGIIAGCFFVAARGGQNFATVMVWSIWWPMLMVMFILAGRAWCAVCPMALAGEAVQRVAKPKQARRIPAWMKDNDVAIPMAGFFLIMWAEAVTGMRHSPFATGILLLSILAGAAVVSYLFPRRAWCRHLCPLGGFGGVCSTSSVLELRPTQDICSAKCKGHDCYTGSEKAVPGCPMFQHLMFVDSNQNCVLCMNCVHNCPNGSPRLNLRWPARELWSDLARRPSFGTFVLMLLGLLAAETLIRHWEVGPGGWLAGLNGWPQFGAVTAIMGLGAGTALAVSWLAKGRDVRFWNKVVALAPLMTAGFMAYQLGFVPALGSLRLTFGYHPQDAAGFDWASIPALTTLQLGVLLAGFGTSLLVYWRLGRQPRSA